MSGYSEFGNFVTDGMENLSQGAVNVFSRSYEKNLDEMFGRLHGRMKTGEKNENYRSFDYKRVAFKKKEQADRFIEEMRKHGIDAVAAPTMINGQYLAEIPLSVSAAGVTNSELAKTAVNGTVYAQSIIEYYKATTFEDIEAPAEPVYEQRTNPMQSVDLSRTFTKHLDTLGQAIDKMVTAGYMLDRFGAGSNKEIFDSKPDVRTGEAKPVVNAGKSKKAIVLNDNTVVIDGRIIEGKQKELILKQHRERKAKADKIVSKIREGKKLSVRQKNAEAIRNSVYRQEYVVAGAKNIEQVNLGGELDKYVKLLNTEAAALSVTKEISFTKEEIEAITKLDSLTGLDTLDKQLIKKIGDKPAEEKIVLTVDERRSLSSFASRYKSLNGYKLSGDEKAVLAGIIEKVKLSDMEQEMFSPSVSKIAENIKEDFGIKITADNPLTREQLLDINAKFIKRAENEGFQFVKANGRFDTKMLKNLNSKQLAQLGISAETRDMLVSINEKGAFGKAPSNGDIKNLLMRGINKMDDDGGIQETVSAVTTLYRGTQYAAKAVTSVRRLGNIRLSDLRKTKQTGWKSSDDKYDRSLTREKKPPEKKKAAPPNAERNDKYIAKQKKIHKKAVKKENGIVARTRNSINKIKKAISESLPGRVVIGVKKVATKYIAMFMGVLFGATFFIGACTAVILLLMTCVQSLLNALNPLNIINNLLAPDAYDETIAYQLYDFMKDEEDAWLDDIDNMNTVFDHCDELRFGSDYELLEDYINNTSAQRQKQNLNAIGDQIYINPFWQSGDNGVSFDPDGENGYLLTEIHDFDGEHEVDVGANTNAYNKRAVSSTYYESGDYLGYSSVENGHTSNIKDIICMADVMYQDGSSDEELTGIIGKSPAQLNWENFCEKVKSVFKWIGKCVSSFFDGEAPPRYLGTDTVSYKTVQNYALNLFEASHQQEITLKTEYYDVDESVDNVTQNAAVLGKCPSPVEKDFKIFWNQNHISPYFTGTDGMKYPVDTNDYDVRINMSDILDGETPCLWNGMDSDKETWEIIDKQSNSLTSDCWDMGSEITEYNKEKTGTKWWDSEENAKLEALNLIITLWNDYNANPSKMGTETFSLSNDKNKFIHVWYEQCEFNADSTSYTISTKKVEDGLEWKQYYWTDTDADGNGCGNLTTDSSKTGIAAYGRYKFSLDDYTNFMNEYNSYSQTYTGIEFSVKVQELLDSYIKSGKAVLASYDNLGIDVGNDYVYLSISLGKNVKKYKTQYKATAKFHMYDKHTDTYTRECGGHTFKFCGGHICVHSQGVVFSATNEQIAMIGVLNEDQTPLAMDFDLKANGYNSLRGKYITSEVDTSTVVTASQSGGCKSPLYDIQGSYTGMQGLNLYVEGEQWKDGFYIKNIDGTGGIGNYHLLRDIFDVDCLIKKGNNALPLRASDWRKYEGWNADNMTLALSRMVVDWYEVYGFDIPWEIGDKIGDGTAGFALSRQDIDSILEALESKYGSSFTESRQTAVELALEWVGRGHYNEGHREHSFLSETCRSTSYDTINEDGTTGTVNYDGCCTASTDVGFINYIYKKTGAETGSTTFVPEYMLVGNVTSAFADDYSDCLPADAIVHEAGSQNAEDESFVNSQRWKDYNNYSAVIYIGTLDSDITLSTGQVLCAGVPLIIDLNKIHDIGNVYLHGTAPETIEKWDGSTTYWWVCHPDTSTKVKRFE